MFAGVTQTGQQTHTGQQVFEMVASVLMALGGGWGASQRRLRGRARRRR